MNIHYTTQFKKDYKRIKKQNKDPDQLKVVIEKLVAGEKLEPKYRDHQLSGNWKGHRDCHIESDWILIYRIEDEDLFLDRGWTQKDLADRLKVKQSTIAKWERKGAVYQKKTRQKMAKVFGVNQETFL